MQLLQEEQLAMETEISFIKGVAYQDHCHWRKKQKIITPSSPAKKSLDEMPTLFKWNEMVQLQALAKKYQFWSEFATKPDQNSKSKFIFIRIEYL